MDGRKAEAAKETVMGKIIEQTAEVDSILAKAINSLQGALNRGIGDRPRDDGAPDKPSPPLGYDGEIGQLESLIGSSRTKAHSINELALELGGII